MIAVAARRRSGLVSLALLVGLALPSLVAAQPGRGAVTAGNRLYDEGRYEEAHEQYLEALREAPDSPIVPFNDGNALYRTEAFDRAMEAYRLAVESGDPAVESQAWYNLGNALYKQQQLEPALEAYKEALRRNPADSDAKHNDEIALEELEQQEQEQQQDQSDDQQDENDENEDQEQNQDQNQDPQDQPSDEDQQQEPQEPDSQDEEPESESDADQQDEPQDEPEQSGEQEPQPGELSREEAERLLQAINEDPSQIQRQRRTTAPARPPRRPW